MLVGRKQVGLLKKTKKSKSSKIDDFKINKNK